MAIKHLSGNRVTALSTDLVTVTPQGYDGGDATSSTQSAGGGGAGGTATGSGNKNGGIGKVNPIVGSTHGESSGGSYYLAGGGGGAGEASGASTGGLGGGGNGGTIGTASTEATSGYGGGAGGGGNSGTNYPNGASGVVILKLLTSASFSSSNATSSTTGSYTILTYTSTSSSSFTISSGTADVQYLVVAGGGASKDNWGYAGGGGAGGFITGTKTALASGTYTVSVGAGGVGAGASTTPANGGNSVFSNITALGGGGAGSWIVNSGTGFDGGSGGGAQGNSGGDDVGGSGATYSTPKLGTSGAADGLGSDADLTLSGTTSYNTGLIGKCLYADFSGTEGQQGTPAGNFFSQARTNNDDFNFIHTAGEAWTINFWVKPDVAENGAIQQLIGNTPITPIESGFAIKIQDRSASNEVRQVATVFNNNGSAMYSAYNGTDGDMPNNTNWAMITVRCNGATTSGATAIDININGGTSNNDFSTPNGTCTRTSSTATARNASYGLMFGRNLLKRWGSTNAHADPFDGSFDEVSIWNRELTDAECIALYNSGSGAVTTTAVTNLSKLIAYWNFNDNVTNQAKLTDIAVTVPNGSVAEETDTGKHKIWNSTTSAWVEVA